MPGPSKKPNLAQIAALVGAGATAATAATVARAASRRAIRERPSSNQPTVGFATDSAFVALIESVAAATSKSDSIDESLRACVEHVCRWTGWPVGHVYLAAKDDHGALKPSQVWHLGHPTRFEPFRALTERTEFE